MSEITLQNVTKRFEETTAVNDVSLTIDDGEVLGVVGPSGCGKTTLLRLAAGFETVSEGTVRFEGDDVTHVPPERRNVGLVFQSYALFDNMSVFENVTFGPKMHGIDAHERQRRAHTLLEMLDIDELAERDPTTLSGGQQQRVGLARALAIEPRILLLDEPMTGLDARLKRDLRTEMRSLLDDLDVTTLYVTHDQEQAMAMCDRIAVMNDGRFEQIGTPEDVYERPANSFVADFIGTSNVLTGTVTDNRVDLGFTTLRADGLSSGDVELAIRPDALQLGETDSGHRENGLTATVTDVFYLGETIEMLTELSDGTELTVSVDRHSSLVEVGDTVCLMIDPDHLHPVT